MPSTWTVKDVTRVHLGLVLTGLVLFAATVFLGETWFQRDALAMHQPWRGWAMDRLARGQWPEWFDGMSLGVPAAGNPLYGATYPLTWLLLPFPTAWAVDALMVGHVILLGCGVARLSRRLGASPLGAFVGGAAMLASGYTVSLVIMGIPLLSLAWTPHILCAVWALLEAEPGERMIHALGLSALYALQLTSGDPAAVITGSLAVLLLVALRARPFLPGALRVGLSCTAALPLAAVMLLPAVYFAGDTERAGGLGSFLGSVWTLHPARALEWVWPHVWGDTSRLGGLLSRLIADSGRIGDVEPHFAVGMYISLPVLLLFVAGLGGKAKEDLFRRRLVLIGLVAFVILALGNQTFLYRAFRYVFLPERLTRYPERHFGVALVLLCACAGVGFTRLFAAKPQRRALLVGGAAFALLAALVGAAHVYKAELIHALGNLAPARPPPVNPALAFDILLPAGVSAVIASGLAVACYAMSARERLAKLAAALTALVVVGHLIGAHAGFPPTLDRELLLGLPTWLEAPLADDRRAPAAQQPRVRVYRDDLLVHARLIMTGNEIAVLHHDSLGDHTTPRFGLAEVPGYEPVTASRVDKLWRQSKGPALERLLDAFGVKWMLVAVRDEEEIRGKPIRARSEARYLLVENEGRRPRAFVVPRWQFVKDNDEAIAALVAPQFDFEAVRLEGLGEPSPQNEDHLVPCAMSSPRPERNVIECKDAPAGYLVVLDAWSPGWSATVDARPVPILRGEALVRAVPLEAGDHVIEMRYRTPGLRLGLFISAAAWLVWLGLVVAFRVRPGG